jgi:hypothetical protein
MTNEVTVTENNPSGLIQLAIEKGADIDQLERLFVLQREWEANEAKKAYVAAKAAFMAEAPQMKKNKRVGFKDTSYTHLTLDSAVGILGPVLAKNGLAHSWETKQIENNVIEVTCSLTHVMGHSERVMLRASPDSTGAKNAIQAVGSTVSYLERYTFLAITGQAAAGMDDDAGKKVDPITEEQAKEIGMLLAETDSDMAKFFTWVGLDPEMGSLLEIPSTKYKQIIESLNRKAKGKANA